MSIFSGGTGVGAVAAAGVVVVGAAAWVQFGGQDAPAPAPQAAVVALPETVEPAPQPEAAKVADAPQPVAETKAPTVQEVSVAKAEPETASVELSLEQATVAQPPKQDPEPAPEQVIVAPPTFDEVRREQDGMTVIAGTAAPGAGIQILLDGAQIATASADGSGKFAALAMIAPDGKGHVLSLLQTSAGEALASADQIILAPIAAPVQVAQVEVETSATLKPEPVLDATVEEAAPSTDAAETDEAVAVETAAVEAPQTTEPKIQETTAAGLAETTETAPVAAAEEPQTETADAAPSPVAPEQPVAAVAEPEPEPETQEVAVLKSTKDGVELLNTPSPEVMKNVALDTISYSDVGDVQLAGRAQPETRSVRVYLNNDAVINLPVDDAGRWRGDLPDVDEGIYTLRVDEVSQQGTVTSRVETPFKREDPEVLAQAAAAKQGPLKQITVQQGATLWAIAQERYGDGLLYVNVFKANAETIRDPDLIYPGQIFELPE